MTWNKFDKKLKIIFTKNYIYKSYNVMDHIWPYMVHIWAYMGHIWPYVVHIWSYMGHTWLIWGHIWTMYGHIWHTWSIYDHIWSYMVHLGLHHSDDPDHSVHPDMAGTAWAEAQWTGSLSPLPYPISLPRNR